MQILVASRGFNRIFRDKQQTSKFTNIQTLTFIILEDMIYERQVRKCLALFIQELY